MSSDRYNQNQRKFPARIPSKPAAPLTNMNLAAMCENNWGQGESPKPIAAKRNASKARPCIWYFLDEKLNVPDQQLSFPSRLFGRN